MVENFGMSSTNTHKLSKFLQEGSRAAADIVNIVARRERDGALQRRDRAIAVAKLDVLGRELQMGESLARKWRRCAAHSRDQ
jgi:hypothetical protein